MSDNEGRFLLTTWFFTHHVLNDQEDGLAHRKILTALIAFFLFRHRKKARDNKIVTGFCIMTTTTRRLCLPRVT